MLPFARLSGKPLQADFDGGPLSSGGGVLFLRETSAQGGVTRRFVEVLKDPRDKGVVGAMRRAWPAVSLLLRGAGHFSRPEVPQWCESPEPVIDYVLGQSGNPVLTREAGGIVEQARSVSRSKQGRTWHKRVQAERQQKKSKSKKDASSSEKPRPRSPQDFIKAKLSPTFSSQADSWTSPHRIICKAEVSAAGENLRLGVINLEMSGNAWIEEADDGGRGQMEKHLIVQWHGAAVWKDFSHLAHQLTQPDGGIPPMCQRLSVQICMSPVLDSPNGRCWD